MGGACCLHDRGVQKLTLNMLCPFLTSPGEGRPQHYITVSHTAEMNVTTIFVRFTNITNTDSLLNYLLTFQRFPKISRIQQKRKIYLTTSYCVCSHENLRTLCVNGLTERSVILHITRENEKINVIV